MILILLSPAILFGLYVLGVLIYGSFNDWKPAEKITEKIDTKASKTVSSDTGEFSFMIWNVGYGGLGAEVDFFYDGGKMVRSDKALVEKYVKGIRDLISANQSVDFVLLQEADLKAKRSYGINEFETWGGALPDHSASHAMNFNVPFVPVKYFDPIGFVQSGVASYLRYTPYEATRYQFPGEFSWPTRLFNLDRCFLCTRIKLPRGKDFVILNTHNSAYDDGTMKKQEMDYLKDFLLKEYEKGNYVVVGGDWNQCPPGFHCDKFAKEPESDHSQISIKDDFMPKGWTWAFDGDIATNRKLNHPFNKDRTFTTVIDFYLVSPNIEVTDVHGMSLDFSCSDHQPVFMNCRLK